MKHDEADCLDAGKTEDRNQLLLEQNADGHRKQSLLHPLGLLPPSSTTWEQFPTGSRGLNKSAES